MQVRTRLLKGDHFKSGNLSHMNVLLIDKKNEILKSGPWSQRSMVTSGKRWLVISSVAGCQDPQTLTIQPRILGKSQTGCTLFLASEGEAQSCPFFPVAISSTETIGWKWREGAGFGEENAENISDCEDSLGMKFCCSPGKIHQRPAGHGLQKLCLHA